MAAAEEKRREVLRRIHDVIHHPDGPRIYDSVSKSRSVRAEVWKLLALCLIEPCDRDGEPGYRRTAAGDEYLAANGGHR